MRRRAFLLGSIGAVLLTRAARAQPRRLVLQPLKPAPAPAAIAYARRALEAYTGFAVDTLPAQPMPKTAWYAPRTRWRADRLLVHLASLRPADAHRIVGITSADISATKGTYEDWGLLGLADIDGPAGVVSSFRTKPGKDAALSARRFAKVCVHEVGHTLGLEHCPTPRCLLQDLNAQIAVCDAENHLCDRCRGLLAREGLILPGEPGEAFWRG